MRKRIFFIVKQLNVMGSAELVAVSFASNLNQEYDVFLYSIEKINGGKINPCYDINPRVIIRSLNLPSDEFAQKDYLDKNGEQIASLLTMSSRENDVFVLFSDRLINHIQGNVNKILIKGFSHTKEYNHFDRVVFLTRKEFLEEISRDKLLANKASYITPFSRFSHNEDFKFHGNKIMCITRANKKFDHNYLIELAKGLKENGLKFTISVCVEGINVSDFENEIIENDLDDIIELKTMSDIKTLYSQSDLFFYFSKNRHYPLFLVEAMSNSIPVVSCSDNAYALDILSNVGVSVHSVSEAVEKIINIFKDKIKLAKLRFETFEYSKRFVKETAIKEIKKIIESLVAKYE